MEFYVAEEISLSELEGDNYIKNVVTIKSRHKLQ
jgi:hypothetical protein